MGVWEIIKQQINMNLNVTSYINLDGKDRRLSHMKSGYCMRDLLFLVKRLSCVYVVDLSRT
jgi:hypothetical protein